MSEATSLMMWAQRIVTRRMAPAHELLEIAPQASIEEAQVAFHKLARVAHPDLHRNALGADELEILTAAYAIVAGAYQTFRTQTPQPARAPQPARRRAVQGSATPVEGSAVAAPVPPSNAAQQMSSKAIVYFRKAELALKRGDVRSAMLQIKLAIAADPSSAFLRSALVEVELELKKGS